MKYLVINCEPRYWEDSSVNGEEDVDGNLIPCKNGNFWQPIINMETGQILNWKIGETSRIHYKVCDAGSYFIFDDKKVHYIIWNYVPDILGIDDESWGDYIIFSVDKSGYIINWNPNKSIKEFHETNLEHPECPEEVYSAYNMLKPFIRDKKLNELGI
jgi:hypothetical protein